MSVALFVLAGVLVALTALFVESSSLTRSRRTGITVGLVLLWHALVFLSSASLGQVVPGVIAIVVTVLVGAALRRRAARWEGATRGDTGATSG